MCIRDRGVGGAGVAGQHRAVDPDDRDVGDAAQVDRGGRDIPEPQGVEEAGQRGTLAARGDVRRAQVRDDRQAGRRVDVGRRPELELSLIHI